MKKVFSAIVLFISALVGFFVGKISWTTPSWLDYFRQKTAAQSNAFKAAGVAGVLLVSLLFYGYHWYHSRPHPDQIIAKIIAPKITPNEKDFIPDVLTINFGVIENEEFVGRSAAPLDLVGKEVTDGISLTPAMAGVWFWQSDNQLVFTPASDWPAGQTYTVHFEKQFFAKHLKMAGWDYTFSTVPFSAKINKYKFYMDPVNPRIRQAVAEIDFNYPVDTRTFENQPSFRWQALKSTDFGASSERYKYSIKYDENKRVAYVTTDNITLPNVERYLTLTLGEGIKAQNGASKTHAIEEAKVLVPDAASIFKVNQVITSIIRNPQDRPEQVLNIETTLGVTQADLDKSLHVYLLPQDYPATMAEEAKLNYEWKNPGEVTPAILALAKPLSLNAIPADHDYSALHSFKYSTSTPSYLYVTIDKGLHGFGDYELANGYAAVLKVPEYPREISFLHKGALLALGTEEKVSVMVRGLAAVKFDIARILPDDVNHLITQTSGDFSNPVFESYLFTQDNISQINSVIQQFDASDQAKQQYTALDLGQYLNAKNNPAGRLGLFILNAEAWDAKNNLPLDIKTKRLILVTDLGLLTKDNRDGTHDVFVQSITKGSPVANVAVSIIGKNGLPLFTRTTDASGRASFPSLNDFINEREPTVYIARNSNDISFIPFNRSDRKLNFSRFDIGGVSSPDQDQAALTAYLFSDRGIYRPGDVAHVGMVVKQPFVMPQPAGLPLEATIIDSRGNTVADEKVTLTDSGYLTMDYQTSSVSPTGQYYVNLFIVKDKHASSLIGSTTLNVQEFLPDRLRISASLSSPKSKGWMTPVDLSENVNLRNLYGAPAQNHRITGKIILTPKPVSFPEFSDYIFLDPLLNPKSPPKVFTDNLAETKTDSNGDAKFNLKLDRFEKATYQLTVFTEGFEAEGGRSVATQNSALVSPLEYLVGYKADGDLAYIKQGETRKIYFISVNPALQQLPLNHLKLQLFNLRPVTTLVKKDDGTYEYQSITQTSQLASNPFAISQQGSEYTLPSETVGDYLVVVTDQNDNDLARFKYSIVGASQQPLPKNAELNVKLSKSQFTPGEEIEMQVTAPYTGAGLITIERDKVYASQWFTATTTSSMQKIRIPADFQGNGYVNIAFVRDLNSPEIYMSPLSYSIAPFSVTHENHEVLVELKTPPMVRPGEALPITYKTNKPGKIIVYAVDEGILQVSRYSSPDPLQYFFQKRSLEVSTSQIVDQILPKFIADRELSAVGGDEGSALLNKNLNPFKRKTDAPVVFWSGIIDTDNSEHQLSYQVPDYFNGSIRVMAVAVATDAVGAASSSSEVRGQFVINPNVPTFVAPGDEFSVTASVANNVEHSGEQALVTVEMQASPQLTIKGDAKQKLIIPEGQERSVTFNVKANASLGAADLGFSASLDDKTSKIASAISVRPASPYATSLSSGVAKDALKSLKLDRVLYPEFRRVSAAVSTSPLILMTGIQRYLDDYPYGCVEQLVSKAFPWLAMSSQSWFNADAQGLQDKIQRTIQMLGQRQTSSGSFSYWPEVDLTANNEFASIYAMHFLTEAKLQGFHVSSDVYSAGIGWLKDFVTQDFSTLDQAREKAYAIYILTRNEIVTTNYLTNLQLSLAQHKDFDWQHDITSVYIAATYQLLQSHADAEKIIAYYQPQTKKSESTYDFDNTDIANAQYLYLIARHFPERLQKLDSGLLFSVVDALNNQTMNTLLSGYTSLALTAFNQGAVARSGDQLSVSETLKDGKENALSASNVVYQKVNIDPLATSVNFKNPGKNSYFYQLVQAGFDSVLPASASSHGIEVIREFTNADNQSLGSVKLGDEIVVHIRARSTDGKAYANVSIVDLLPGGFEVVRSSVANQNMDYVDVREDRVIFFGYVDATSHELVYHIKATNAGKFIVPPIFAASMYNPAIYSSGHSADIKVNTDE